MLVVMIGPFPILQVVGGLSVTIPLLESAAGFAGDIGNGADKARHID
ncbi:MAG TPA: hypothetical protein VKY22_21190 [Bradyrhizobium sp.]|nr:hypothetical protein [Bradyrhizobium sp.]